MSTLFTRIKPPQDRVVVIPQQMEKKTIVGFTIPDPIKRQASQFGEIVAISRYIPDFEIGDKVVFEKYAGEETELIDENGEIVLVRTIRAEQILFRLDD